MQKLNKFTTQLFTVVLPILIIVLPFFIIHPVLDNDIWFMLNHGRYILNNGFTNIEPFTVHEGFVFSFEKWLSCIIFYLLYDNFGKTGVLLLVYTVGIICSLLIWKITNLLSEGNKVIGNITALLVNILLNYYFITSRPQIFSYVCLILEFYLCELYARTNDRKYLKWLPLISLLYMQLHSTMWPMFFIVLLPYMCEFKFVRKLSSVETNYELKPIYIVALICFLVGFINPYGMWSVTYLFRSIGMTDIGIKELGHGTFIELFKFELLLVPLHLLYFIVFFFLCGFKRKLLKFEIPVRYLYFLIGTLIMYVYATRNVSYHIIFAGVILAAMYREIEIKDNISKIAVFFIIIMEVIMISLSQNYALDVLNSRQDAYDLIDELSLRCESSETKIYTNFNIGAYAEWKGFRAYIDPRAEVFYDGINQKKDVLAEFRDFEDGKISVDTLQNEYGFEYWVVSEKIAKEQLDKSDKYKLILKKGDYAVYEVVGKEEI